MHLIRIVAITKYTYTCMYSANAHVYKVKCLSTNSTSMSTKCEHMHASTRFYLRILFRKTLYYVNGTTSDTCTCMSLTIMLDVSHLTAVSKYSSVHYGITIYRAQVYKNIN